MSSAQPDIAASAPPKRFAKYAEMDVAARGHLRRWLVQLAHFAVGLGDRLNRTSAFRLANPTAAKTVDLDVVWALVTRAMRWTVALNIRFTTELSVGPKAVSARTERRRERPAASAQRPKRAARRAARGLPPDRCIDGKSVGEVVAQICADLRGAATLMEGHPEAAEIAAIAVAARALLGGPDAAWTARPPPASRRIVVRKAPPSVLATPTIPVAVRPPDSG
jgi:hypothetical protein